MKLIIAIVRDVDDGPVIDTLVAHHFRVTRIATTGGFLRHGNVTLLIGADEHRVESVIELLRATCSPAEAGQHRATVFVVDATHFEQI